MLSGLNITTFFPGFLTLVWLFFCLFVAVFFCLWFFQNRSLYGRSLLSFGELPQCCKWFIWVRILPWRLWRRWPIMHWYWWGTVLILDQYSELHKYPGKSFWQFSIGQLAVYIFKQYYNCCCNFWQNNSKTARGCDNNHFTTKYDVFEWSSNLKRSTVGIKHYRVTR